MTTIYLLRHGESALNTKQAEIVSGRSNDTPLTPLGIEQAHTAGAWFAAHTIIPSIVVSSPARRAATTIEEALKELPSDYSVTIEDRIQEISQGIMEGQPRNEVWTPEAIATLQSDPMNFMFPEGETFYDVQARMLSWYRETAASHPDAIVLAGSHGLAIRALAGVLLGWDHAGIIRAHTPNCSLTRIDSTDTIDTVVYVGRDIIKSIDKNA